MDETSQSLTPASATGLVDDARYRLLIDSITDYAIYMLDPDGFVSSWNPGAQRFKGYTANEVIGSHFSLFYTPCDRAAEAPATALRTAAQSGRFEAEGWRVRKSGAEFWAHVVIDPIRAPDGSLLGFAKITRDLSERREAEEALKQSEAQFRLLVQGVTDYAIYMLDPQGRVSNWNAGAERIKGYTPDDVVGRHFGLFYTDEDRANGAPEVALATAVEHGRFEKEGWRVRKDGVRFWAHVVIDAIRGDDGKIIGFAKVTRDISERKAAEEALEIAREALLQSQKMEAIGQLTGGVAHDFNNLLMAVLGSLELVRKRVPFDPKVSPLIDNAIQAAERGAALTQRMLAFARKQELKFEPVEITALVQGMTGLISGSLGPAFPIETRFPPVLPPLQTDPAQLEAAILNLAVNARDAMPNGGRITISADLEHVDAAIAACPPGDYIRLSVADSGHGMDDETRGRAMEPFFTTKGVGKGTGLGLSMVHGLAVQSGGRMDIDSTPRGGTTVTLWLPVAHGVALRPKTPPGQPVDGAVQRLRVLAVDDDALVLMNTEAMLEDLGHHVRTAMSGPEALELMKGEGFDLVITDFAMPQMSGVQLAARIAETWPRLPVILATGYAELPAGVDPHLARLPKPFMLADLAAALARSVICADGDA